jgi:hypothetical protein
MFLPYLYVYLVARGFSVDSVAVSMASFYLPSLLLPFISKLLDRMQGSAITPYILALLSIQMLGVTGLALLLLQPSLFYVTFFFAGLATTMTSPLLHFQRSR